MSSLQSFAGKVVLVTGGTKGVGRGIAECYLGAGATVLICGRNAPEATVCSPEADGRSAIFYACDVRDPEAVAALFAQIMHDHGRLDVLVNNAGGTPFVKASQASPKFHESIIRLNLLAPLQMAQQANEIMQKQPEGGVIVFIGSIGASRPQPGTAAYGAAKAGILSLTQSLAVEWAPQVRVVSVSPGYVNTEQSIQHYGDEAGIAAVARTIALQRMAMPADIGNACVFVSSPQAAYVSGTDLLVHGGGERPAFLDAANVNKE